MQILDFIKPEMGTMEYEVINFPDGQKHLRIKSEIDHKDSDVRIRCRIRNAEELFLLVQALDVLNRHGLKPNVFIYYLMGARMDRITSFNEPFTLKLVTDILSEFNACFNVLEAHNPQMIKEKYGWENRSFYTEIHGRIACYPDAGAYFRYRLLFTLSDGKDIIESIVCQKKRDLKTGKLSGFELDCGEVEIEGKDVIVRDDLIDGGGTFCGIAPLIRDKRPSSLTLNVCHAIQLEGIKRVTDVYDKVIISNSYFDWETMELPDNVEVKDVIYK